MTRARQRRRPTRRRKDYVLKRATFLGLFMALFTLIADAKPFLKSKYPIPNRYIVALKRSLPREQVPGLAKALAHTNSGRVIALFDGGFKGFGFAGTEAQ